MLWWELLGRLKWRTTGLDAPVSFFSTSQRCWRKRSANLLPVSPIYVFSQSVQVMQYSEVYGDARKSGLVTFKILRNDRETKRIFSLPPLTSFKRDKNLGNFLVRSAFKSDNQPGTFKCKRTRCKKKKLSLYF